MKTLKKLTALTLSVILLLSVLAGCGSGAASLSDAKDDPAGYLQDALNATLKDLADRYSGSPLAAIPDAAQWDSGEYSFAIGLNGMEAMTGGEIPDMDITGNIASADSAMQAELSLKYAGAQMDAGIYYSPEFVGISIPFILGSDTYYGCVPHDIYEQAQHSIFNQPDVDLSAFAELDTLIETFKASEGLSFDEMYEKLTAISADMFEDLDFDVDEDTIDIDDEKYDCIVLSTTLTADVVADYMGELMGSIFDSSLFSGLIDYAEQSGADMDLDAQIQSLTDEIRSSDIKFDYTAYISDGKLIRVEAESKGDSGTFEIVLDYYADGGDSLVMSGVGANGEKMTISSTVDTSDGYTHTVSVKYQGETVKLTTVWEDSGELSIDLVSAGQELISINGYLNTDKHSFDFDGTLTVNDGYDSVSIDLTLSGSEGAVVSEPASGIKNIFEMSEEELYDIYSYLYTSGLLD